MKIEFGRLSGGRRLVLAATVFMFIAAGSGVCAAEEREWTGNINFFFGAKSLNNDDWSPVENQGESGVEIDFMRKGWPVGVVVDSMRSFDEVTVVDPVTGTISKWVESSTSELNIGVKKTWKPGMARPFIGGGLSLVRAEYEEVTVGTGKISDSDTAIGVWVGVGAYWTLGKHFNIGFELKRSYAEAKRLGKEVDAGGGHAGLLLGYHW
ncbi:MAG: hypothetical protein Q8J64_04420 [Thermodesulfovibrionales bacterium]|nr:hypothetical protein [Thermodesulfovibrionales bacterium]